MKKLIKIKVNWQVNDDTFDNYLKDLNIESFLKNYYFRSFEFKIIAKLYFYNHKRVENHIFKTILDEHIITFNDLYIS